MEMLDGFAELVRRPESEVDLAEGALMIASGADPGLDPSAPLASLDEFAEGVHDLVSLCRRLFVELGFRGEPRQYHSPINSLLHRVDERRRGIPITLSVVTLEVARRASVPLEAIGMPAHFLVRDPFYIRELIKRDCQDVLRNQGVRFNDFGTLRRANRFALKPAISAV